MKHYQRNEVITMTIFGKFTMILSKLVAWITLIVTLTVVYDVIVRYLLDIPSEWPSYLTSYGFAYLIMIGGVYVQFTHCHIRTDMIYNKLNLKGKALADVIFSLCLIIFCAVLVWTGWVSFVDSLVLKKVQAGVLAWPLWPHLVVIPLGAFLTMLWGFADLYSHVYILVKGRPYK